MILLKTPGMPAVRVVMKAELLEVAVAGGREDHPVAMRMSPDEALKGLESASASYWALEEESVPIARRVATLSAVDDCDERMHPSWNRCPCSENDRAATIQRKVRGAKLRGVHALPARAEVLGPVVIRVVEAAAWKVVPKSCLISRREGMFAGAATGHA